MISHSLDGYLQPVQDEYMSEYPPAACRRLEWLSGFSGSAGTLAILADSAALFTDGRYTLQAAAELDATLFSVCNTSDTTAEHWIADTLGASNDAPRRIGYYPFFYTRDALRRMQSVLEPQNIQLVACDNLIDAIWQGRPALPMSAVFIHPENLAGERASSKRQRIAAAISAKGADAVVLTAPESVNWLLNIRGRDIEHTPIILAYAILHANGTIDWYIDAARCNKDVIAHLGPEVRLVPSNKLEADIRALVHAKKSLLCDPSSAPVWFMQTIAQAGGTAIEAADPCLLPKALKNPVELQGIRDTHIIDGIAVTRLLAWLERETPRRDVTEIEVAEQLLHYRRMHADFVEPSFPTIAGSGPNGAIVHYRANLQSNRILRAGELFLLDSGGQYPGGTTDITRTIAIGTPSSEQKDRFTRVLKGHIALANAVFPRGTQGSQLDALARQYLWQIGCDYDHGTGHGVGHFLSVHEGPQRISKRGGDAALAPGMLLSNEPGYYKTGEYGIRIENLVVVVEHTGKGATQSLGFATVTCVPIDQRLIDQRLLTAPEKDWLNQYHSWVCAQLSSHLSPEDGAFLQGQCAAIA